MIKTLPVILTALAFSNVWLWINLWNIKQKHFKFEHTVFRLLWDIVQLLPEDSTGQSADEATGQSADEATDKV